MDRFPLSVTCTRRLCKDRSSAYHDVCEQGRELCKARNLTLRDLAAKVGVGFSYLSRVENAKLEYGDYPSDALICKLANAGSRRR